MSEFKTRLTVVRNGDAESSSVFLVERDYLDGRGFASRLEIEGISYQRALEKLEFYSDCYPDAETLIDCR